MPLKILRPRLLVIPQEGPIETYTLTQTEMQDGWPKFEVLKPLMKLNPLATIEHLRVEYEDRPAHLFFDEDGLYAKHKPNAKASRLLHYIMGGVRPTQGLVGPVALWVEEDG